MRAETVEIRVKPCKGNTEGRLVINKCDLRDDHVLFEESNTLVELVVFAIESLDKDNEEYWTAGKPKTDILSDLVGERVSAKVRDEAWERVNG